MMRVVLHTNVLVSALIFPGSAPSEIFKVALKKRYELYVSSFILNEFQRVLEAKFMFSGEEATAATEFVRTNAQAVEPIQALKVIAAKDADNRILECAMAAKADFLVTGDKKHIRKIEVYEGIKIVLPAEFYRILREKNLLP